MAFDHRSLPGAAGVQPMPYSLPKPPPGVVPANAPTMAQDDAISSIYNWASSQQSAYGSVGPLFPGYTVLAELAQRPEYRRGSEIVAEEMTRKWIKLTTTGAEKADRLADMEAALERYGVRDVFHRALLHDGIFGVGHIFLDFEVDDAELRAPLILDPRKVKKGSLKSIRAIDPTWCYPQQINSLNPLQGDFYKPTTWFVMGKAVSASRLLTIISREVPDIIKPAYMFGGLSRTMMAHDYVENFIRTRRSVSDLIHSFSTMILNTDLDSLLNAGASDALFSRIAAFVQFRDNKGVFVADKTREEVKNVSVPLGGLDSLQAQSQEQIASVQSIPLVKLLGISPSGLNASSDGEIRVFYDSIHANQEKVVRPALAFVLDVIQLSEFGEIDPEIRFQFEPLWQMSETELVTMQKTRADTHAVYVEMNAVASEEVREQLAGDEDSPYHGLDLSVVPEVAPDPAEEPDVLLPDNETD